MLVTGFDEGKFPKLFQTEPAGTYHEWKVSVTDTNTYSIKYIQLYMLCLFQAAATGKSAKTVREFLEKNYSEEAVSTRDGVIILAIRALLEVGAKY